MKKAANKAPKAAKQAEDVQEQVTEPAPEAKPEKKELDPDRLVTLDVIIQGRFKMDFPKSMPQDERIRVAIQAFIENWPKEAYVKVNCQNMKEHHSRADVWRSGLGWPAWKGQVED